MGQIPVQTVPVCPVQIRAHHHIDVNTDINNDVIVRNWETKSITTSPMCSLSLHFNFEEISM